MAERVQGVYGLVRDAAPVAIGRRFLPLPHAQLLRGAGDGRAALLPASPGTPVHVIAAGTVSDIDGQGAVAIVAEDGTLEHYAGLDPAAVTVRVDSPVRAGAIIGRVSDDGRVEIRLSDRDGRPLDAVELLIGLPDPSELGLAPVGEGLGVDPDELDRELAPEDPSAEWT
jgi:murein DD-endopeptidase MepM/ murein hydrolase activator NlpD